MSDTWWGPSIKNARPIDRGHALAHEALVIRRIERGDPNVILVGSNVFVDCSFEVKDTGFIWNIKKRRNV